MIAVAANLGLAIRATAVAGIVVAVVALLLRVLNPVAADLLCAIRPAAVAGVVVSVVTRLLRILDPVPAYLDGAIRPATVATGIVVPVVALLAGIDIAVAADLGFGNSRYNRHRCRCCRRRTAPADRGFRRRRSPSCSRPGSRRRFPCCSRRTSRDIPGRSCRRWARPDRVGRRRQARASRLHKRPRAEREVDQSASSVSPLQSALQSAVLAGLYGESAVRVCTGQIRRTSVGPMNVVPEIPFG